MNCITSLSEQFLMVQDTDAPSTEVLFSDKVDRPIRKHWDKTFVC